MGLLVAVAAAHGDAATPNGSQRVKRVVLAVYDSAQYKDVRDTRVHRLLEMPLNHLGMVVRYRDLRTGLPSPEEMQDVRGIVAWFQNGSIPHLSEFLKWGTDAIDSGKRFVAIGHVGVSGEAAEHPLEMERVNEFFARLGLRIDNWTSVTYDRRIVYQDSTVIGFERPLPVPLPSFDQMRIVDPAVRSHLTIGGGTGNPAMEAAVVVTGPHGGWIESGFSHFVNDNNDRLMWYVNPFEFLRLALATDELPKPDTTTLSGRRIYYSHIDGDGWRNLTEVTKYRGDQVSSAEVVLKEAIEPFPDLPVTVGPIAGDLDEDWFGTRDSLAVARRMLSLPWVEAGSHTYSHPLDWETLFQHPPAAGPSRGLPDLIQGWLDPSRWTVVNRALERYSRPKADEGTTSLHRGQAVLRSYSLYPFNPDQEIAGSIAFLNRLLPPGKHVAIMQWSGSTLVPESVLRATRRAGIRNINGGDTRFDREFSSYAWVAPLSRQVGTLWQVYSSDSNENTYTNLWNERFFGFRYLRETFERTESPVRIKPVNIYYHMYSGEKQPGIDAVVENLRYARSQQLAPITASRYAAIVNGFHTVEIEEAGPRAWKILNRDGLDTIRFDHADADSVDWAKSRGVVGQRYYQGSLYVALDAADREPVVALAPARKIPQVGRPYLIQSRWRVSNLCAHGTDFEFEAQGFGAGEMEWSTAPDREFEIQSYRASRLTGTLRASSNHSGMLEVNLPPNAVEPIEVKIHQTGGSR